MVPAMTWTFAWDAHQREKQEEERRGNNWTVRIFLLFLLLPASWLLAFATGFTTTLGMAEGSERHNRYGVYVSDDFLSPGLGTMYLVEGQHAYWDYDVRVEGTAGIRLRIGRTLPRPDQFRLQDVQATGNGRFEFIVPESGFYSFDYEHAPLAGAWGHIPVGSTTYKLRWGAE